MKFILLLTTFLITANLPASPNHEELSGTPPFRSQAVAALKESQLGKMFRTYMTKKYSDRELINESTKLAHYVFSEGGKSAARFSGIQILTEDMYEEDVLDSNNVNRVERLILLRGNISQMRAAFSGYPGRGIAKAAMAGLAIAALYGSPLVRNETSKIFQNLSRRLPPALRVREPPKSSCRIAFSKLASKEALKGYRIRDAMNAFFGYFGSASFFYWYYYDWSQTLKDDSIEEMLQRAQSQEDVNKIIELIHEL